MNTRQSEGQASALRILREVNIEKSDDMSGRKSPCIDHGQRVGSNRYGMGSGDERKYSLHRLVYVRHYGLGIDDIDGLVIRHRCDNKRCVNPDHLLAGTQADNMRDMSIRRRNAFLKLTESQVLEIRATCKPSSQGGKYTTNPYNYESLAKKFGVSSASVRAAYLRITFRHSCLGENA